MDRKSKCNSEKHHLAFSLKTNEQIVNQEGTSLSLSLYQGQHMNQEKKKHPSPLLVQRKLSKEGIKS